MSKENPNTPPKGEKPVQNEKGTNKDNVIPELSSKIDWKHAREVIAESFPPESIQVNTARTGNEEIGVKPQYVIERLNEAFGFNHWAAVKIESEIGQNHCLFHVNLLVGSYINGSFIVEAERSAYGGSRIVKGNLPDALKGAQTDAIKKAASMFNIAGEIYKGTVTLEEAKKLEAKAQGIEFISQPKDQKAPICPKDGAHMVWKVSKRGPFWGCSNYPECNGIVPASSNGESSEDDGNDVIVI